MHMGWWVGLGGIKGIGWAKRPKHAQSFFFWNFNCKHHSICFFHYGAYCLLYGTLINSFQEGLLIFFIYNFVKEFQV